MGNIGLGEMLVLMLVAMLIFGPNKLPEIARSLGKALRAFQQESKRAADVLATSMDERPPVTAGVIDTPDTDVDEAPAPVLAPSPDESEHPPHASPPADPEMRRLEDT